ncbi:dTDP-4-dehydrorhamnose 3,5-epimerase [Candidatus Nitrosarchaeum limnium]|uniref:dTDP-4-dehydrorhamnose 3,5-epimerase n=1 Tax=Candidatus Nitrosarchaeum limnium BG20 TaxID=859192 RepID=S2ESF4_9ARCH|nr:dTDP-4-dehydrorhamnose 3,5-epimerase [Candidatus Nitrosarchaeum limnium]EPA05324.1 dTDP-4-dehydrorhamnose 3,5-epimerase [Candidatus Nitrosarchaeum limnium BG20]
MTFNFTRLEIPDLVLITPNLFYDERGYFFENFHNSDFKKNGVCENFAQENFSFSKKNVIRGLHFQKLPKAQSKLITVSLGEIFDVAVDLRKNSSTYGQWISEILSENNHKSLFIPEGFAHGFCVLSNEAIVLYKTNQEYSPEHDGGILWNDPKLNISWPISNPILSKKDQNLPLLKNLDYDFDL